MGGSADPVVQSGRNDRWPLYRFPSSKHAFKSRTRLILPRSRRSKDFDEIAVKAGDDVFVAIYTHYMAYLPEGQTYPNYCGNSIAVRKNEVLSCDPYFGGFVMERGKAFLIVYDDYLHESWCLKDIPVGSE
jgi:hypothetical protein